MSFARLRSRAVEVIPVAQTGTDEYGNPVEVESAPVLYQGYLEQTTAVEVTTDRDTQKADWLLVLPEGAVIDGTDRVQVDGQVFEVVGPPARVHTPRGEHHVEARLRARVSG